MALKKQCSKCGKIIEYGNAYCDDCKKVAEQIQNKRRTSAAKRGYDSRWRKARISYLRANPLCIECTKEGKYIPATIVDHVKPHKGDKVLFWDKSNWQPLCKYHHDVKTASEDGGFGNGNTENL